MPSPPELIRRQAATQATLGKYRDKPFSWADGCTCVHMLRFHLRKMGHKPPPLPRIRSALSAKRALRQNGWNDCADMLDTILPRIPLATTRMGDVLLLKSGCGLGAVCIAVTPTKVIGWHDDDPGMQVLIPNEAIGAWRA